MINRRPHLTDALLLHPLVEGREADELVVDEEIEGGRRREAQRRVHELRAGKKAPRGTIS